MIQCFSQNFFIGFSFNYCKNILISFVCYDYINSLIYLWLSPYLIINLSTHWTCKIKRWHFLFSTKICRLNISSSAEEDHDFDMFDSARSHCLWISEHMDTRIVKWTTEIMKAKFLIHRQSFSRESTSRCMLERQQLSFFEFLILFTTYLAYFFFAISSSLLVHKSMKIPENNKRNHQKNPVRSSKEHHLRCKS